MLDPKHIDCTVEANMHQKVEKKLLINEQKD